VLGARLIYAASMDERMDEILARLAALERRVAELGGEPPEHPETPEPSAPERTCFFQQEEQRIVDLIVGLTAERVIAAMDERMERDERYGRHEREGGEYPRREGGRDDGRRGPPPPGWGPPPPGGPPPGWPRGGR